MKKYNVSIHFQTKTQTTKEVNWKLQCFFDDKSRDVPFDFSERSGSEKSNEWSYDEPLTLLHHCFLKKDTLKEKNKSTSVYDDVLDSLSEHQACWQGVSNYGLTWSRVFMLRMIKQTNGVCLFIGDIIGGVKEEYEKAKELGIECILIDYKKKST